VNVDFWYMFIKKNDIDEEPYVKKVVLKNETGQAQI
jgi:hypothetical protein